MRNRNWLVVCALMGWMTANKTNDAGVLQIRIGVRFFLDCANVCLIPVSSSCGR